MQICYSAVSGRPLKTCQKVFFLEWNQQKNFFLLWSRRREKKSKKSTDLWPSEEAFTLAVCRPFGLCCKVANKTNKKGSLDRGKTRQSPYLLQKEKAHSFLKRLGGKVSFKRGEEKRRKWNSGSWKKFLLDVIFRRRTIKFRPIRSSFLAVVRREVGLCSSLFEVRQGRMKKWAIKANEGLSRVKKLPGLIEFSGCQKEEK